jgi:uncharacterized protein (TIGR04255 family)
MKKIPPLLRLKDCRIVDSICEIRFDSALPRGIAVGAMTAMLRISELEKLPALQVPEQIRNVDEQFRFAPLYAGKFNDTYIQLGDNVIVISSPIPYVDWNSFRAKIESIVSSLIDLNLITSVIRIGRRTINFYDYDILPNLNFNIASEIDLERTEYHYMETYKSGDATVRMMVSNQAIIDGKSGSAIDIDSFIENEISVNDVMFSIDSIHFSGKEVFFTLLEDDFIKKSGGDL